MPPKKAAKSIDTMLYAVGVSPKKKNPVYRYKNVNKKVKGWAECNYANAK